MTKQSVRCGNVEAQKLGLYSAEGLGFDLARNVFAIDHPNFTLDDLCASLRDPTDGNPDLLIDTGIATAYGHDSAKFGVQQLGYYGTWRVSPQTHESETLWEVHGVVPMPEATDPHQAYTYLRMIVTTNEDGSLRTAYVQFSDWS